jgi:allantoicase
MSFVVSRPTNLADPRLGATVVFATDDFFADKARLIAPSEPVFVSGKYDDNGKWMDGWESRRKRVAGHDAAIVKLARPGAIEAIEIDTRHFTGNYPPAASLEACVSETDVPPISATWSALTPVTSLNGDDRRYLEIANPGVFTHVRLNIVPDGGVARLRIYGRVRASFEADESGLIDLAAATNGGRGLLANDAHFGKLANMLLPGRGANMGDGWETRRRREPGFDWAILRLGRAGVVERLEIDTAHFRGNYPDRVSVRGARAGALPPGAVVADSQFWPTLLEPSALQADHVHVFAELRELGVVDHLRVEIHPDGGLSRVRAFGRPAE